MLFGSAAMGAALTVPTLACGGSKDSSAFATTTTAAPTSSTASPSTTAAASGAAWPSGGEMVVNFTFAPSGGGFVKNPYVAVWVERPDGTYVRTISLWIEQGSKGRKYVPDMRKWYSSTGGTDVSMSGATRAAGTYAVTWNGTDARNQPVAQGDYVIYIEAAREKAPYELLSQQVSVGTTAFTTPMTPKGEVTAASIVFTP